MVRAAWEAAEYLPVVLPLALATVIGGIDCTESAAAVGDHYSARQVIGVEAIATLVASFCGGVIQTTPYIGHPAYKAMGGRSAYTLATALFIGAAGVFGFFGYFFQWIPEAVVYPILIFVGLEITAQSFLATPQKHYPAVALACVPALAFLSLLFVGQIFGDESVRKATFESNQPAQSQVASSSSLDRLPVTQENLMNPKLKSQLQIANMLKSGFVVTSLLWASSLAFSIDRRMFASAALMVLASCFTLFGIIHSPIPGESIYLPFTIEGSLSQWALPAQYRSLVFQWALGYALTGLLLGGWGLYLRQIDEASDGAVKGEGI